MLARETDALVHGIDLSHKAIEAARVFKDGRIAPVERLIGWWSEAIREQRPMVPGLGEGVASQRCCD
jgi:hypothetical protein